jgi:hypothetical protein
LEDVFWTTAAKCCVDSTFKNVDRMYLYKSSQDLLASNAPMGKKRTLSLQMKRQATLARQTVEWGMLVVQTSFQRLKDRFAYKERGQRRIVLKMFVLLYNMQLRMLGLNQIQNTYMRHLECNTNEDVWF